MAYVLARQDTGCKRSAANTTTPPDAMSRGVFRVGPLTPYPTYVISGLLKAISLEKS